jgi:phospholipase C
MIRKKLLWTTGLTVSLLVMLGHATPSMADDHDPSEPQLTLAEKVNLLRKKVKYVFVIFHENESFDHFFGTFPGANGLFTAPDGFKPAKRTPSFVQTSGLIGSPREGTLVWRMVTIAETDKGSPHGVTAGGV